MYQARFYDDNMSDSDQEMIEEILGAPIDKNMYSEARYQAYVPPPVLAPLTEQNIINPADTTYQVMTQEVPIQTNVFTNLPSEDLNKTLPEPLQPIIEQPYVTTTTTALSDTKQLEAREELTEWTSELPISQYPIKLDPRYV